VDPAAASLEAARRKPGADAVTWILGTWAAIPDTSYDVAVMTSHVAQFLVDDGEWTRALRDLRRSLVGGGRLVFDSRDPREEVGGVEPARLPTRDRPSRRGRGAHLDRGHRRA
jgi:hypothetical protein